MHSSFKKNLQIIILLFICFESFSILVITLFFSHRLGKYSWWCEIQGYRVTLSWQSHKHAYCISFRKGDTIVNDLTSSHHRNSAWLDQTDASWKDPSLVAKVRNVKYYFWKFVAFRNIKCTVAQDYHGTIQCYYKLHTKCEKVKTIYFHLFFTCIFLSCFFLSLFMFLSLSVVVFVFYSLCMSIGSQQRWRWIWRGLCVLLV